MENNFEYTLTLNSDQAREALKSFELLMRLKLGQYRELPYALLDIGKDNFVDRRDAAEKHLAIAFDEMYRDRISGQWKDTEWYRLYNLYQVVRKAIHDAENPTSTGVDSYEPIQFTEEPLPKIKWEKK